MRGISHLTNNQKSNGNGGLMEEEWFHGVLPREEVVRLLVNEGDFLVRETMRNDECQIVLSVCWDGHKHFIVQTTQEVREMCILMYKSRVQNIKIHIREIILKLKLSSTNLRNKIKC